MSTQFIYQLPQLEKTQALSATLAALCPPQCVLFLKGPLGSGKTSFARGLLQTLGNFPRIKSPTYTLVETYHTPSRRILHFDLYRLQDPQELEILGIRDYIVEPAIWLIEWPERGTTPDGSSTLPQPDILLNFKLLPSTHQLTLQASTVKGSAILQTLSNQLPPI